MVKTKRKTTKDFFFKLNNFNVSGLSTLSYIFDWIIYTILTIASLIYRHNAAPRYREFSLADDSLSNTFYADQDNLIGRALLLITSIGIPIVQIIIMFGFSSNSIARRLWNIHNALLAFLASHSFQSVLVSILKNIVASPRPDFIQRCIPSNFNLAPLGQLSNVRICSNPNINIINDGFRSLPSGHASTSFASSLFSFSLLASRNRIFDGRGIAFKALGSAFPFVISFIISASRVSDNRHFVSDIWIGAIIGLLSAYLGYRMYFPEITNLSMAGVALPPRRIGVRGQGFSTLFWKLPSNDSSADNDTNDMDLEAGEQSNAANASPTLERSSTLRPKKSRPQTSTSHHTVRGE